MDRGPLSDPLFPARDGSTLSLSQGAESENPMNRQMYSSPNYTGLWRDCQYMERRLFHIETIRNEGLFQDGTAGGR